MRASKKAFQCLPPSITLGFDGFTLVEVLVAMGVMAIIGVAMMSMLEMNSKGVRNVTQQSDSQSLANLIQMDLNVDTACSATFLALPVASRTFAVPPPGNLTIPVPNILTGTIPPRTIAAGSPATPNTFNSVVLKGANSMSLQNFTQTGPNSFIANLVINASAIGASLGAQSFIRKVPVAFLVSISGGAATITGCGASSYTSTPTTCVSHPGFTGFNGYYKDPSGLITQWGLLNSSSSDNTQISVNFPIPFPNNCFVVTGSEVSDRAGYAIGCASTSQLNIRTANHDTCVNWIAYGN